MAYIEVLGASAHSICVRLDELDPSYNPSGEGNSRRYAKWKLIYVDENDDNLIVTKYYTQLSEEFGDTDEAGLLCSNPFTITGLNEASCYQFFCEVYKTNNDGESILIGEIDDGVEVYLNDMSIKYEPIEGNVVYVYVDGLSDYWNVDKSISWEAYDNDGFFYGPYKETNKVYGDVTKSDPFDITFENYNTSYTIMAKISWTYDSQYLDSSGNIIDKSCTSTVIEETKITTGDPPEDFPEIVVIINDDLSITAYIEGIEDYEYEYLGMTNFGRVYWILTDLDGNVIEEKSSYIPDDGIKGEVVFENLSADETYTLIATIQGITYPIKGDQTLEEYEFSFNKPGSFSWTYEKIKEQPLKITATEWKNFIRYINTVKKWYDGGTYSFQHQSNITSGTPISADICDEARLAIQSMSGCGLSIVKVEPEDPITAKYFNDLVDALNDALDNKTT